MTLKIQDSRMSRRRRRSHFSLKAVVFETHQKKPINYSEKPASKFLIRGQNKILMIRNDKTFESNIHKKHGNF